MLPVYKAISFQDIIEKGGRTKPWVIVVNAGNNIQPFVVKLFEKFDNEVRGATTNEVLGNVLAREFNLPVPQAAFIDFDNPDFLHSLEMRDSSLVETLDSKDFRIKFGTELLEGYVSLNASGLRAHQIKQMIPIDTLFAFDNLIRNQDRKERTPNILVRSENSYLIDHELAFDIQENSFDKAMNLQWEQKFAQHHLLYNHLKHSIGIFKEEYFNEFEEYLRLLNVNILNSYFQQLDYYHFPNNKQSIITDYLSKMKNNSFKFVNLLRSIIQ